MVRPLPAVSLALLLAVAALPAVQAQAGANDPKVTVALEVSPKGPTIPLGGSQTFNINVKLSTSNIFCTNQGTVTVALALTDSGLAGVTGTLPSSIDVPVAANLQPGTATTTSGGNATAHLAVAVASSTTPDHDHSFTVTATTPAALPSGCQALSAVAPPSSSATLDVSLRTGPAPGGSTGTGGATVSAPGVGVTASSCGANVSAPGVSVQASNPNCAKKSFFLPLQVQVLVLLAVGLVARRR